MKMAPGRIWLHILPAADSTKNHIYIDAVRTASIYTYIENVQERILWLVKNAVAKNSK